MLWSIDELQLKDGFPLFSFMIPIKESHFSVTFPREEDFMESSLNLKSALLMKASWHLPPESMECVHG